MRYWIPAGAVSPDEEKEADVLTDETQRTQSQADRYEILDTGWGCFPFPRTRNENRSSSG